MDRHTISTLLNLLSATVGALGRLEDRILQHEAAAERRHVTSLEAIRQQEKPGSWSISLETLAKAATHLTTLAAALAKAWGPALAFAVACWKILWPWLRSVLGLG